MITLDWYGCTTFHLHAGGSSIWLDAFVDRVPGADGPPGANAAGITEADWILVGHSHIDHLWGAETIAINTGATIVGSYESCRLMRAAGVPDSQLIAVAGGERIPLGEGVDATVYPALHSCWWGGYDDANPASPCLGGEDLHYFERHELANANIIAAIEALDDAGRAQIDAAGDQLIGDGGVYAYLITTPDGSIFFKDTPGHWTGIMEGIDADVALLGVSGRPHVDGQTHQGSLAEFVIDECRMLNARRMIPCHHDNYMPGLSGPFGTAELKAAVTANTDTEFVELDYSGGYDVFAGLG